MTQYNHLYSSPHFKRFLILRINHSIRLICGTFHLFTSMLYFALSFLFCMHFLCFLGCFFSSDTESAHDEKTDKPEKKPVKISNFFSSLLKGNKTDADVEMAANKVSSCHFVGADLGISALPSTHCLLPLLVLPDGYSYLNYMLLYFV